MSSSPAVEYIATGDGIDQERSSVNNSSVKFHWGPSFALFVKVGTLMFAAYFEEKRVFRGDSVTMAQSASRWCQH